jgi:hypothetical protein
LMLFPRNRPPVIEGAITDIECLKTVIISSAELGAFLLEILVLQALNITV